jgi:hypothetical protein
MYYLSCHRRNFFSSPLAIAAILFLIFAQTARAHVGLEAPNGGEMLTGGSTFTIAWRPEVAMHDTLNFDLSYSTTANDGPWIDIAIDLPPGDLTVGSFHTYLWTVPNITDTSAWIRVRQDNNLDQDYEDVSESAFSIVAALPGDFNSDGAVNTADYVVWRKTGGTPTQYNTWRGNFGAGNGSGAGQDSLSTVAAPEPNVAALLIVGIACWWKPSSRRFPRPFIR